MVEKCVLHNFQYMINVSTQFQKKSNKTVGGVHNVKLLVFCTQSDRWPDGQRGRLHVVPKHSFHWNIKTKGTTAAQTWGLYVTNKSNTLL